MIFNFFWRGWTLFHSSLLPQYEALPGRAPQDQDEEGHRHLCPRPTTLFHEHQPWFCEDEHLDDDRRQRDVPDAASHPS